MNPATTLPILLFATFALLLASGIALLVWGRKFPRQGDWLAWLTLAVAAAPVGLGFAWLADGSLSGQEWIRGWILPREDAGALTVGLALDSLGLTGFALALFVGTVCFSARRLVMREPRPERIYSATLISISGVAMAWISSTPWLAMIGVVATAFGGFVALSSRSTTDNGAAVSARFAAERAWGILFAAAGACGLAVSPGDALAAALLMIGVAIQLQPFPFLGLLTRPCETPAFFRTTLIQVFPAWAAFALLMRMSARLHEMGAFQVLGWFLIGSAVLAAISGVTQIQWRHAFACWLSAAVSLSTAILAFSGSSAGFAVLLGTTLGALAIGVSASAISTGGNASEASAARALWMKISAGLGAAAATGVIGFVTVGGVLGWLTDGWVIAPMQALVFALSWFLFSALVWKLVSEMLRASAGMQFGWAAVLYPLTLTVAALGIVWSGAITGGALADGADQVTSSFMKGLFPNGRVSDEAAFTAASWSYWISVLLAAGTGIWASTRWKSGKVQESSKRPSAVMIIASGYGVDVLGEKALYLLKRIAIGLQSWVDRRLWSEAFPKNVSKAIAWLAGLIARGDERLSVVLRQGLSRGIEIPAKGLQLLQTGDVQWYIFFAVGSGVAMLIHFWRT